MEKAILFTGIGLLFLAIIAGVWTLFWWLWNTVAAGVFGAPELTFWQAVGLLFLIGMLTSGFSAATSKY